MATLIGPFAQLVTMEGLPPKGPINDVQLKIVPDAGIVFEDGKVLEADDYSLLEKVYPQKHIIDFPAVAMPGFVDAHTHICFSGSRAADYALRVSGKTYQEIAARGGGILDTVKQTREASREDLLKLTLQRAKRLPAWGVTTCEIKSGYGLNIADEIKMLEVIRETAGRQPVDILPTCLAAHTRPPEFKTNSEYLSFILENLMPILIERKLTRRIDIFVEKEAFTVNESRKFLHSCKQMGFAICLHADQFNRGGAQLAAELNALSADHLEQSNREDFLAMEKSGVVPVFLPGASLGLGIPLPPARLALDCGLPVAIASDWNPGSAPMGNLLTQAAILGAGQRLTLAETIAGITVRAAKALGLHDRGVLSAGLRADMAVFPCMDYREVLYHQGSLAPRIVFIRGMAQENTFT